MDNIVHTIFSKGFIGYKKIILFSYIKPTLKTKKKKRAITSTFFRDIQIIGLENVPKVKNK